MLTQYAFSILFIDKKKAKFSNDRFGITNDDNLGYGLLVLEKGDTHVGRTFLFLEL